MKTYCVTGAAGFIGSHLTRRLLDLGHSVIAVDNLSSGFIEYLPEHKNLTFINVDLSDWEALTRICGAFKGADAVFHLAAKARIQPSIQNPFETHHNNVNGIFNLLSVMRIVGIDKIIYSASSSSYGAAARIPCIEDTLMDCLNPYSLSKYIGELYCKTWGKLYGIKNVSLRYFNVYGTRSPLEGPYATVIGLFFRQVLKDNVPMTIVGDGTQKRDFTHVDDVVRANLAAKEHIDEEGVGGQTFNVGTGTNHSINQIAEIIEKEVRPYPASHSYIPARPGETNETLADVSKIEKYLGWKSSIKLEDAMRELKIYFMDNLEDLRAGKILT